MHNELSEICETLDGWVQNQEAHIYIFGQHALDEPLSFGTTDAYLRLASALLKFVGEVQRGETLAQEIGGIKVESSGSINDAFDPCSEIIKAANALSRNSSL